MDAIIADLDGIIEAYEGARQRGTGRVEIRDFAPPATHPHYREIVTELIRVDMEHNWLPDDSQRLARYRSLFPDVLAHPQSLAEIAFEEFRLRRLSGEPVEPREYEGSLGIDVASWPGREPAVAHSLARSGSNPPSTAMPDPDAAWQEWSRTDPEAASLVARAAHSFPRPGQRLGEFELVEELGRGAFARVFLARQADLASRLVALKVSPFAGNESRHLAQLQHTHIVPVYSFHRQGGLHLLCMPFLGRATLGDVLRHVRRLAAFPTTGKELVSTLGSLDSTFRESDLAPQRPALSRQPVTVGEHVPNRVPGPSAAADCPLPAGHLFDSFSYVQAAVWIVTRVAEGLVHAHERGIVHRDLKPANILLADNGQPLILDFNISTELSCSSPAAAMIGGTLPYMSPEQLIAFRDGGTVDARSDLYSLGIILYELLTGQAPFSSPRGRVESAVSQMLAERSSVLPSARRLNPRVTPGLESIIARCLAFEVADRYQSARELREDLDRYLHDRPLQHAAERSLAEAFGKWTRRHPRISSSASVTAAAVVLGLTFLSAWLARGAYWERVDATATLAQLADDLPVVRVGAGSFGLHTQTRHASLELARQALRRYRLPEDPKWMRDPRYQRLTPDQQSQLKRHVSELMFWLAQATWQQARQSRGPQRDPLVADASQFVERARSCYLPGHTPRAWQTLASAISADAERTPTAGEAMVAPSDRLDPLDEINDAADLLRAGDFAGAASRLESITRERPRDFAAWFWLGYAYWGQGQSMDAEVCFSVCITLRPDTMLGVFQRGLVRLERQAYFLAYQDFDRALVLQPDFAGAFVNRGIACQLLADDRGAIRDFSQALELGAAETRIFLLRSRSYARLGDVASAEQDRTEGLARTPVDEWSWLARGYARLGADPAAALEDFRTALRINPTSTTALQNIAGVLSDHLHQPAEAIAILNRLVDMQPKRALWRSSRAVLRARGGERESVLQDLQVAHQLLAAPERKHEVPLVRYQTACAYALLINTGDSGNSFRTLAIKHLAAALSEQSALAATAEADADLANVRGSDACLQLLEAARHVNRIEQQEFLAPGVPQPAPTVPSTGKGAVP